MDVRVGRQGCRSARTMLFGRLHGRCGSLTTGDVVRCACDLGHRALRRPPAELAGDEAFGTARRCSGRGRGQPRAMRTNKESFTRESTQRRDPRPAHRGGSGSGTNQLAHMDGDAQLWRGLLTVDPIAEGEVQSHVRREHLVGEEPDFSISKRGSQGLGVAQ